MSNKTYRNVQDLLQSAIPAGDDHALEEVARLAGYVSPKIVKALRSGDAKVPLDKAFVIADVIGFDRADFFTLCLKQFLPDQVYIQFMDLFHHSPNETAGTTSVHTACATDGTETPSAPPDVQFAC